MQLMKKHYIAKQRRGYGEEEETKCVWMQSFKCKILRWFGHIPTHYYGVSSNLYFVILNQFGNNINEDCKKLLSSKLFQRVSFI